MKDYTSWMHSAMDDSMTCLLMTISEITKDKEELDAAELDDLKDCWHTIKCMHKVKHHMHGAPAAEGAAIPMHTMAHSPRPAVM